MYMMKKIVLFSIMIAILLIGCRENRIEHGIVDDTAETVDVSFELLLLSDISMEGPRSIIDRVIEEYPDLSLISRHASYEELLALLNGEQIPNMIYITREEVTEEVLEKLKIITDRGIATIIPADIAPGGLYYNKDLFDKFGLPYPKDGMDWDDVVPMIRKLTRQEGGVQYYGFAANVRYLSQSNPWSLPLIDRDLRVAVFNNELWKSWLVNMNTTFNATDKVLDANGIEKSINLFVKDKTLAMWAGNDILYSLVTSAEGLNWDVVSLPYYPEISLPSESVAVKQKVPFWVVSDAVENSDEAYLILSYLLSHATLRNDTKYLLGEIVNIIKGKNISTIFKNNMKRFTLNPGDPDDSIEMFAREELYKKLMQVITNQIDANTALREAEEMTNLQIRAVDSR
ncbi:MAG: hypothetical protein K0Q73_9305 [Paenibacillus sp.]|jgi:multiple sugar transport system substrate-binding protein|nr:hypothetical protein [Paenibacillus sp.]